MVHHAGEAYEVSVLELSLDLRRHFLSVYQAELADN